jgi:hypothetical protein
MSEGYIKKPDAKRRYMSQKSEVHIRAHHRVYQKQDVKR